MVSSRKSLSHLRALRRKARRASSAHPALEALETRLLPTINVADPSLLVRETTADNDTAASAQEIHAVDARLYNTPKENWLTVVGSMAPGFNADSDYYKIKLDKPAALIIDVDNAKVPALESSLTLYDANNTLLLSARPGKNNLDFFTSQIGTDPSLYYDLPAGSYFIQVRAGFDANFDPYAGDYVLRVLTDSVYTSTVPIFDSDPRPGIPQLYMDFDGHTSTNDHWTQSEGIASYTVTAFNISGKDAQGTFGQEGREDRFSPGELYAIKIAWRTAAENFAPFNVNVTTREPAAFPNGVALRNVIGNRNSYFLRDPDATGWAPRTGSFLHQRQRTDLELRQAGHTESRAKHLLPGLQRLVRGPGSFPRNGSCAGARA
jgi:hypothetical protein